MITSRQNSTVQHLRKLGADAVYRRSCGEFIGVGSKLLAEAEASGLELTLVWTAEDCNQLGYIANMQSTPDCVFSAKIPAPGTRTVKWIILEDIQDPGNVGTVLRSAGAFGFGVVLSGDCADPWQLKVVRASMGAVFRVNIVQTNDAVLWACENSVALYGTSAKTGEDIASVILPERYAVAIGNEGHGLRESTISKCIGLLTIPISAESESLNAAVAASIIMYRLK